MKRNLYLCVAMLLLATCFMFSSCDKAGYDLPENTKELLMGTWQTVWEESELISEGEKEPTKESHEYTKYVYTFNTDGFGSSLNKLNGTPAKMKWSLAKDQLTCEADNIKEKFTIVEITETKLILQLNFTGKLKGWVRYTLKKAGK